MPRKDGTGPQGKGPKTGRGTGACAPAQQKKQDMQQPHRDGRGVRGGRRDDMRPQRNS